MHEVSCAPVRFLPTLPSVRQLFLFLAPTPRPLVSLCPQASRYVSFPAALRLLGLPRPAYSAASLGKETGSGPHSFVANATYQVGGCGQGQGVGKG